MLHWNGKGWSQVSKDASVRAYGPVPDGHNGLWMTAESADYTTSYIVHFGNGRWTSHPAVSEPGDTTQLGPLDRIPGTASVWAAGQLGAGNLPGAGVILKYGS